MVKLSIAGTWATQTAPGTDPKNVIDGVNNNSIWKGDGSGASITFDLGQAKILWFAKVFWDMTENFFKEEFMIEASSDKSSWSQIYKGKMSSFGAISSIPLDNSFGRYVRFTGLGSTIAMREVEFDGASFDNPLAVIKKEKEKEKEKPKEKSTPGATPTP